MDCSVDSEIPCGSAPGYDQNDLSGDGRLLTLGPRALVPDSVAPNVLGSHNCSMSEDSVELSVAVLWEPGVVGTVAGMAPDMAPVAGDHTAGKKAVGDTVVDIAAGIAADRLDFHVLVEAGNAVATVRP